jgi:hypothetical protein
MNNPKTRDDDERSGIANQKRQNQTGSGSAEKSQREGPAAYAPLPDEQTSADEAREKRDNEGQGVVRDERGQEQPADKKRAQQTNNTGTPQVSQNGQNSGYSSSDGKKKGQP